MSIQIKLEGGTFDGQIMTAKASECELLLETRSSLPYEIFEAHKPIPCRSMVEVVSRFERYRRIGKLDDATGLPVFKAIL
jgi:hypothetical protein